jgi:hypothetical protein
MKIHKKKKKNKEKVLLGIQFILLGASKNHLKNQNQPQFKNQFELRFVFSNTLKVEKYLI